MDRRAATYQLTALLCLLLAAILEVSGVGFFGLDLLVGLLLLAPLALAPAAVLQGGAQLWGLIITVLAALGLAFHLILNFGLL